MRSQFATFCANGDLYVSGLAGQVEQYDGVTGAALGAFTSGGTLGAAIGIICGPDGNLYVSSQEGDRVNRYNGQSGDFIDVFASGGGLDSPTWLLFLPGTRGTITVEIDIRPGRPSNIINPFSPGITPVAVLGSAELDVEDVDLASLAFGPAGAPLVHAHGPHYRDVNGDEVPDLVGHFRTQDTGIAIGDEEACLSGEADGVLFSACDGIRTVSGACGLGAELAVVVVLLGAWRRRRRDRRAVVAG